MSAGFSAINTLTAGAITVDLSDDIGWPDEFAWSKVVAGSSYTLTGSLVLDQATRTAGRPITLASSDNAGWINRAGLKQLAIWRDAGTALALTLRGAAFVVRFDPAATNPIEAQQVMKFSDPADTDWYAATLHLIEVPA